MAPGEPLAGLLVSTMACFPLWCWLGDSATSGVDLFQMATDFLKKLHGDSSRSSIYLEDLVCITGYLPLFLVVSLWNLL